MYWVGIVAHVGRCEQNLQQITQHCVSVNVMYTSSAVLPAHTPLTTDIQSAISPSPYAECCTLSQCASGNVHTIFSVLYGKRDKHYEYRSTSRMRIDIVVWGEEPLCVCLIGAGGRDAIMDTHILNYEYRFHIPTSRFIEPVRSHLVCVGMHSVPPSASSSPSLRPPTLHLHPVPTPHHLLTHTKHEIKHIHNNAPPPTTLKQNHIQNTTPAHSAIHTHHNTHIHNAHSPNTPIHPPSKNTKPQHHPETVTPVQPTPKPSQHTPSYTDTSISGCFVST